jgi:hypothetical protein
VIGALMILALGAYVVPKRVVWIWMRPRDRRERERPVARSRTRGHMLAHVAIGLVAPAAVVTHAGVSIGATSGGALLAAFAVATVLGAIGSLAYRTLPPVLTRMERSGALPEDLAGDAGELRARLFREISGTSALVKRLAEKILVPYARAPLGWVALAESGRGLAEEERRLRARIDRILEGRGGERLAGLDRVIRLAVEVRALPGRRVLTAVLRGWLPLHVVIAAATVALLGVHVLAVLR